MQPHLLKKMNRTCEKGAATIPLINQFLFPIMVLIFLISCSENEESLTIEEPTSLLFENDAGKTIEIILEPHLIQPPRQFASFDKSDDFLVALEESSSSLNLNKKLYEDLAHYFDPYEIYLMDNNGLVTVGNTVYKADEVGHYRQLNDGSWELLLYYGISGNVDLEETALKHQHHLNLEELENYEFKSPAAREVYERLLIENKDLDNSEVNNAGRVMAKHFAIIDWEDPNTDQPYIIKYRNYMNGPILSAKMQFYIWNEDYKHSGKKRMKGGTYCEIFRFSVGQWQPMPNGSKIGNYHENNTFDTSTPYTYVRVFTNKNSGNSDFIYDWQAFIGGVSRSRKQAAKSYHTIKIRRNNSNIREDVYVDYYLG